ncbi:MAG TPA: hypothetical protein VHG10_04325 [Glycomyces sp.]|nr:hypothetical protein [Glycomyces sp.]
MNRKRLFTAALVLAMAVMTSACVNEGPWAYEPGASEAATPAWQEAFGADVPCSELGTMLGASTALSMALTADYTEQGPGVMEDMVPGADTRSMADTLTAAGLELAELVPEDVAAHVQVLTEAGTAITGVVDDGGSLAEAFDIWAAPEVEDARSAVQSYVYDESGCVP